MSLSKELEEYQLLSHSDLDTIFDALQCFSCKRIVYENHEICPLHMCCRECLCHTECVLERNNFLHQLLQYIPLPCKNRKEGCTLAFDKQMLFEHLNLCYYARFKCPLECGLEISQAEFQEHVSSYLHQLKSMKVKSTEQFEISVTFESGKGCFIWIVEEWGVFVCQRIYNPSSYSTSYSVQFAGTIEEAYRFRYSIRLFHDNRSFCYSGNVEPLAFLPRGLAKRGSCMVISGLRVEPQEEEIIHISLQFLQDSRPSDCTNFKSTLTQADDRNVIPKSNLPCIWQFLKCRRCKQFIYRRFYMVKVSATSGTYCYACASRCVEYPSVDKYSFCALNKLIYAIPLPCKNTTAGCKLILKGKDWDDHIELCSYSLFECPMKITCRKHLTYHTFFQHICECHPNYESINVCELKECEIPIKISSNCEIQIYRIEEWGVFVYRSEYDNTSSCRFHSVQYVGTTEEASKYKYNLSLTDCSNSISYSAGVEPIALQQKIIAKVGNGIYVSGGCKEGSIKLIIQLVNPVEPNDEMEA